MNQDHLSIARVEQALEEIRRGRMVIWSMMKTEKMKVIW